MVDSPQHRHHIYLFKSIIVRLKMNEYVWKFFGISFKCKPFFLVTLLFYSWKMYV